MCYRIIAINYFILKCSLIKQQKTKANNCKGPKRVDTQTWQGFPVVRNNEF